MTVATAMTEREAEALCRKILRHPGWHCERIPGWTVGHTAIWWYVRAWRDQDDDDDGYHAFYVLRDDAAWQIVRRGLALIDRGGGTP